MKLPYRRQGYIFFRCQYLNEEESQNVKAICEKTGYGNAIYEYITTDASSVYICQRYYISEKWLSVKTTEVFRELDRIM